MEIERELIKQMYDRIYEKQRKSPENGDWKLLFATSPPIKLMTGNKESLLKMEIESPLS